MIQKDQKDLGRKEQLGENIDIHSIYRVALSRKQWLMVISGDRSSGYQRV